MMNTRSFDIYARLSALLRVSTSRFMTTLVPVAIPGADEVLRQAASENFAVASRLLSKATRRHLLALYGFARLTDEIGDEVTQDQLALLDWLDDELELAARGEATHPLLRQLTPTIAECNLPLDPFHRLIEANRRDQLVHRYETFEDLVSYARLSAAPVGQLVLAVLGETSPERTMLSDDVCVGLQIVEHIQDVKEDLGKGRVYLPQADLRVFGCGPAELDAPHAGPELRMVLRLEAGRARRLLSSVAPLGRTLPLRFRFAVCGFAAGGMAALDAIERMGHDVLGRQPRPRPLRLGARLTASLWAASTGRPL
jgi:squalene synthase HpnC